MRTYTSIHILDFITQDYTTKRSPGDIVSYLLLTTVFKSERVQFYQRFDLFYIEAVRVCYDGQGPIQTQRAISYWQSYSLISVIILVGHFDLLIYSWLHHVSRLILVTATMFTYWKWRAYLIGSMQLSCNDTLSIWWEGFKNTCILGNVSHADFNHRGRLKHMGVNEIWLVKIIACVNCSVPRYHLAQHWCCVIWNMQLSPIQLCLQKMNLKNVY